MQLSTLLKLIRFWPPFWGAGISVREFNKDYSRITVQLKMRFWNKNYVGSHYGGSLYSMTDPFYMLMLMKALGREYIVWDKFGTIRYKKPAHGKVFAEFELSSEQVKMIKQQADENEKSEPVFEIKIVDSSGTIVAEIVKTLYVKRK
ncbi:hypothetical protein BN59_02684 [Legionella massiliensis]|uniref:Tetrameric acyl-CoA thioesterase n=1 Tax=Legionella massiliensis TaxID=1034943 RepID=A0A078L2M6_9GAMM|nr:DUF4442 domain-containing protein [Legionella massiliensis]CDZ78374.1 hypothetical protein BN59_02684 [Legionella massiliensis]CEE14112.1 hypothetical protein BN1094_02684 [Legionella massiliensis]